jgi:hypothetical protein
MDFADPETAPTILPFTKSEITGESEILWARVLAYVTGTVNQELLLRNEYLATENRILRGQIKGRLLLSEGEKATLAEIGHRLPRKSLRLCLARLRVRWFDPIAEPADLPDHSCRALCFDCLVTAGPRSS